MKNSIFETSLDEKVLTDENVGVAVYFKHKGENMYIALTVDREEFMSMGLSSRDHVGERPITKIQEAIREATDAQD